jgi:uncharacterized repeat protein (TIGR03803 family)
MHVSPRAAFHFFSRTAVWMLASILAACGQSQLPPAPSAAAAVNAHNALRNLSSEYQMLYSFPPRGGWVPESNLTYVKGRFYGTTYRGGTYNSGILFSLDSHGKLRTLHEFESQTGYYPTTGLTQYGGALYGTTLYGGPGCHSGTYCGFGTVYHVSSYGEKYQVLYSFTGGTEGAFPGGYPNGGNLVVINGTLFGTTLSGGIGCPGSGGCGTIFSITPSGKHTTIYRFSGLDGQYPEGLVALHGMLYGTTLTGGNHTCPYSIGCGTIFSLTTSGHLRTLYDFSGNHGYWPESGMTLLNGRLYGTTSRGGVPGPCIYFASQGCGTVFELRPSGQYRVLHRFQGQNGDGATPYAALLALNGKLYGTTLQGPAANRHYAGGAGTVFSITPGGDEVVLHAFGGPPYDGEAPAAALSSVFGALYGTTQGGGPARRGTIFSLTP